jgi:hypothetical protein
MPIKKGINATCGEMHFTVQDFIKRLPKEEEGP